jgi:RNA polymerase sigma-70 factor (ECF subfamily)
MDQSNDQQLFQELKMGDERAFQLLFVKYYAAMCSFAFQLLKDREAAEETVQDTFVRIWEKREKLSIDASVKHYLFRAIRNHCLNLIQHEKIRKKYADKVMEDNSNELQFENFFPETDLIQRIEHCIESLPPKRQEIFRLSREQGLKYKEIAETLNISIKTVEAQMGLALKHLREELKDFSDNLITLFFILKKSGSANKG